MPDTAANKQGEAPLVDVAIRLKITNSLITEAEQLVLRSDSDTMGMTEKLSVGASVEKMGKPHAIYRETIPEAEQSSREELIKAANYYFSGMQKNDGKGYYHFTDDCHRIENGKPATNVPVPEGQKKPDPKTATMYSSAWGCKEQFESGLIGFVTRIRDRRFVAVDRERGIVFSFGFFGHDKLNWTWQIAELFKIEKGKMRRIEGTYNNNPISENYAYTRMWAKIHEKWQVVAGHASLIPG